MEKWYIFDCNQQILRWCNRVGQFDNYESAERFLRTFTEGQGINYREYCKILGIYFKKCEITLDPGDTIPIDLTNKIVRFKGQTGEATLERVKDAD